ncbi:hypothetical protein BsWGS_20062 [Bradybaena similaris]
MTCRWQHPVNYSVPEAIRVACFFTVQHSSAFYKCPQQVHTGCHWALGEFRAGPVYRLQVLVTNTRTQRTASATFTIHTLEIVQPAPAEQLTAIEDSKRKGCFLLSWSHPRKYRPKVYRIQHRTVGDTQSPILSVNTEDTHMTTNDTHMTSCGHRPHTHHNFSVQCLPTSVWSGKWSDPVFTDAWTSTTAPGLGPRTANGSFTSTECREAIRNVTVMWQEVEKHQQNGVIDSYIIQQGNTTVATVSSRNFSADLQLPCFSTSEINIYAHNKGGYSLQPSVIIIPNVTSKASQEIRDSFAVKITSNQTINQTESLVATWDVNEEAENTTYTIFWCMSQSLQACQGEVNWMVVPGPKQESKIPLTTILSWNYLFGISVMNPQSGLMSSIHWTQCLFIDNPSWLPPVEHLRVDSWEGGVWISWNYQRCTYQSKFKVTGYIIKWHLQSGFNEIHEARIPATESSYKVTDLTANVPYLFTVQAVQHGTVGKEVQPWISATMRGPEAFIGLPTLIGLCAGTVGLICVCCLVSICKSRRKKLQALGNKQAPVLMRVQSASEESRITRRSVQTRSAEASDDSSQSSDSCDGGSPSNSRTLLLTSPAHARKTKNTPQASTSSLGVCNEASTCSSIPYVKCATNVQISAVHIEPAAEQSNTDRECDNREQHDAWVDFPELTAEPASTIRSNLSSTDYIHIIGNNPVEHIIAREHDSSVLS